MCWTRPGWTLGLRSTLMVDVLEVLRTLDLVLRVEQCASMFHELDQVPPPLHSLWVFTMGGGEGCHTVSSFVRAVQAGVLDMPLDTREQGWPVLST